MQRIPRPFDGVLGIVDDYFTTEAENIALSCVRSVWQDETRAQTPLTAHAEMTK
jgi:hypothetical protein